ncbi:hypothetical protein GO001_33615 [Streptomyces sp. NRRL B-1677]|uniref:hypothetical protein n=1 Tax=Streptomyces sp. NRRL B-1677 TaxID=2682966 RepID=UPI0018928A99|nr:hypothetical protein [Streptomyces sp. NRRL B-1677]MBF6050055.1 hypothetical protein [Streptomyces sp. NRRL B-1677]
MTAFRPANRHRALFAASLLTGTSALALALATPTQAASLCFNGSTRITVTADGEINGTAGNDDIRCLRLVSRSTINGLGGDDTIRILGTTAVVTVNGDDGNDTIFIRSLGGTKRVNGGDGEDDITVTGGLSGAYDNRSAVSGGNNNDILTVDTVGLQSEVRGDAGDDIFNISTVSLGGRVEGNDGNDRLRIASNCTMVMAGGGDDIIEGPSGTRMHLGRSSYTDGGNGTDTCRVEQSGTDNGNTGGCENTP